MHIERHAYPVGIATPPPNFFPGWGQVPPYQDNDGAWNRRIQLPPQMPTWHPLDPEPLKPLTATILPLPEANKTYADAPQTPADLDFSDALREARAGKAVARRLTPDWALIVIRGELFHSVTDAISGHHEVFKIDAVEEEDILAADWFVI